MIQESWEFSLSWHRSEITEIMAGHLRSAPLVPIAAGVEAAIIWALGGWIICGNWPGWSELTIVGVVTLSIIMVIMVATEARRWRAAAWRSWQITPDWRGGAYVSPPTRRHGHMLMCVHAAPEIRATDHRFSPTSANGLTSKVSPWNSNPLGMLRSGFMSGSGSLRRHGGP
ncbi:hypothetical protein TPCU411_p090 (plasmid) [Cutibacterium acnes]|nr:hypothetical protein TPCU411_p090 [Cutibacterium acnes]